MDSSNLANTNTPAGGDASMDPAPNAAAPSAASTTNTADGATASNGGSTADGGATAGAKGGKKKKGSKGGPKAPKAPKIAGAGAAKPKSTKPRPKITNESELLSGISRPGVRRLFAQVPGHQDMRLAESSIDAIRALLGKSCKKLMHSCVEVLESNQKRTLDMLKSREASRKSHPHIQSVFG